MTMRCTLQCAAVHMQGMVRSSRHGSALGCRCKSASGSGWILAQDEFFHVKGHCKGQLPKLGDQEVPLGHVDCPTHLPLKVQVEKQMNQLLDECSRFRDEMGEVSDYITLGTALETIWSGMAGQHSVIFLPHTRAKQLVTCPLFKQQPGGVCSHCQAATEFGSSTRRSMPAAGSVLNVAASPGCC